MAIAAANVRRSITASRPAGWQAARQAGSLTEEASQAHPSCTTPLDYIVHCEMSVGGQPHKQSASILTISPVRDLASRTPHTLSTRCQNAAVYWSSTLAGVLHIVGASGHNPPQHQPRRWKRCGGRPATGIGGARWAAAMPVAPGPWPSSTCRWAVSTPSVEGRTPAATAMATTSRSALPALPAASTEPRVEERQL